MSPFDYQGLLKKAKDSIATSQNTEDRFKVPELEVFYEGNTTVIRNFEKISDAVNRDPEQILKFLLNGLGTAGERDGGRVIFQGKIPADNVQNKLKDYIDSYVICSECGRPDTHLVKKGRNTLVRCDACGAFRPMRSQKKRTELQPAVMLKEGGTYDVTIKDIGKKGDGVAYIDKYIIYISGGVKGATVKIKVEKISGTVAFARIISA